MEVIGGEPKRTDNQLLTIMHLSQLLTYITGFGGLIVPIIIWVTKKDEIQNLDIQGKTIINFQLSMILYALISIPLLFIGVGFVTLLIVGILTIIMPIINGINAGEIENPNYPLTIHFI